MSPACAHNARTDAAAISRQVHLFPARLIGSGPGQAAYAPLPGWSRQDGKRSANAVWVHAHPGFKSPSLRH